MDVDAGALFRALAALWPSRPDPIQQLERQVYELELRQKLGQFTPPHVTVPLESLVAERRDFAIIGARGTGKTATAFALALASKRPVFAVDIPPAACIDGIRPIQRSAVTRAPGAAIVWDEAALRIQTQQRDLYLWEILALARQRDQIHVFTSQSATAVHVDVLRQDVQRVWLPGDSTFERSELLHEAQAARNILTNIRAEKGTLTASINGVWIVSRATLPPGWTEDVSRLWR